MLTEANLPLFFEKPQEKQTHNKITHKVNTFSGTPLESIWLWILIFAPLHDTSR